MDAKVIERFNRLLVCFGRLEVLDIGFHDITFRQGFRRYLLTKHAVVEKFDNECVWVTEHSRWINAIADGGVRDESGEITNNEVTC